jgi:hypothetical protein
MINDLTVVQLIAGIARMLVSIGWMYALVITRRAGNRLSAAATEAMARHMERIEAQR